MAMPCCHYRCPPDIDLLTICSEYCPPPRKFDGAHSATTPARKRSGAVHHARWVVIDGPEIARQSDHFVLLTATDKCDGGHRIVIKVGGAMERPPIRRSDSWAETTALAVPCRLDQRGTRMHTLLVLLKPVVERRHNDCESLTIQV